MNRSNSVSGCDLRKEVFAVMPFLQNILNKIISNGTITLA
jgi:hypothetical protein